MRTTELLEAVTRKAKRPTWKGRYDDLPPDEKIRVNGEFFALVAQRARDAKAAADLLYNDLTYAWDTTGFEMFSHTGLNRGVSAMTNRTHDIATKADAAAKLAKKGVAPKGGPRAGGTIFDDPTIAAYMSGGG